MSGFIGNKKWFVTLLKILAVVVLVMLILSIVKTCSDCAPRKMDRVVLVRHTGYLPENEKLDSIPRIDPPYNIDSLNRLDSLDSLPHRVLLEQFFPPIGNQGNQGTCVSWATGYNTKTALNAIDNKWTKEQLADPAYQTSPRDLWYGTIPHDCRDGSTFWDACKALGQRGASTMKNVPYSDHQPCNGAYKGDAGNTISSFDFIENPSLQLLKAYIRDTVPLLFAAKVGERFENWVSDQVFKSDINIKKGGHAMVLVGYDDSLHAFRIRNSWGSDWGDKGSAWVDYDFFLNNFYIHGGVFVLKNGQSHPSTVTRK